MTTDNPDGERALLREAGRAGALFLDFFLIIFAYYHVKPASRSLVLEYLGKESLPYIWIASALTLAVLLVPYHRIVARYRRIRVVQGSVLSFILLLLGFRLLLGYHSAVTAVAFYIFLDIFSVVLVEQFWSLANTTYRGAEGRRWYGLVAAGGPVGGVAGGFVAGGALGYTAIGTANLLLVAAGILAALMVVNHGLDRLGFYRESGAPGGEAGHGDWRALIDNRYLGLIAACLLCAQLCEPIVEYQFLAAVETAYRDLDARTAYLSLFLGQLNLVSITVNLLITPLVLRWAGLAGGLVAQPLLVMAGTAAFMLQPTLLSAAMLKIADRGLSYSINRAAKELLYIPVDPVLTYRAKAWIDMFGYRSFKVLGAVLILILTQWSPVRADVATLGWLTLGVCALWLAAVVLLTAEYRVLSPAAA